MIIAVAGLAGGGGLRRMLLFLPGLYATVLLFLPLWDFSLAFRYFAV